jgi:hypothetical protein
MRWFCRVSVRRAPDATARLRWARTVRPPTLHARSARVAVLAKQAQIIDARPQRVEASWSRPLPLPSPTASGLLADGVRVRTRVVLRATPRLHTQRVRQRSLCRTRRRAPRRPVHTRASSGARRRPPSPTRCRSTNA